MLGNRHPQNALELIVKSALVLLGDVAAKLRRPHGHPRASDAGHGSHQIDCHTQPASNCDTFNCQDGHVSRYVTHQVVSAIRHYIGISSRAAAASRAMDPDSASP